MAEAWEGHSSATHPAGDLVGKYDYWFSPFHLFFGINLENIGSTKPVLGKPYLSF